MVASIDNSITALQPHATPMMVHVDLYHLSPSATKINQSRTCAPITQHPKKRYQRIPAVAYRKGLQKMQLWCDDSACPLGSDKHKEQAGEQQAPNEFIYACMLVYLYIYVCINICVCVCVYVCVYIYAHIYGETAPGLHGGVGQAEMEQKTS